jgi:hypothetical protein
LFQREDFVNIGTDAPLVQLEEAETQTSVEITGGECYHEAVEKPAQAAEGVSTRGLKKMYEGAVMDAMETTEHHMMSMTDFLKDFMSTKLNSQILQFEAKLMDALQQPEASHDDLIAVKAKRAAVLVSALKDVSTRQDLKHIEVKSELSHEEILSSFYDNITTALQPVPKHDSSRDLEEALQEGDEDIDKEDAENWTEGHESKRVKKRVVKTTSVVEFKLGKNRITQKLVTAKLPSIAPAQGLMQRVLSTPVHRLKNVMVKRMLLKTVGLLYEELILHLTDIDSGKVPDFKTFVYESLKHRYGLNKVAETKFTQVLSSCIKFKSSARIRNFSRFLGLYEPFDNDDLEMYLKTLETVQRVAGKDWHPAYHDEEVMIPMNLATEAISAINYEDLPLGSAEQLRKRLEETKTTDSKGKAVQLEFLLMSLVEQRLNLKAESARFAKIVFDAADVRPRQINGDGCISLPELEFLLKCIGSKTFKRSEVRRIFRENADVTLTSVEGSSALTYENFASTSKKYQLFSNEAKNHFLGVTSTHSVVSQLNAIKSNLDYNLRQIERRYAQGPTLAGEEIRIASRLDVLRHKILSKDAPEMLLLAYKLIDYESKLVAVDAELERVMPVLGAIAAPAGQTESPRSLG